MWECAEMEIEAFEEWFDSYNDKMYHEIEKAERRAKKAKKL